MSAAAPPPSARRTKSPWRYAFGGALVALLGAAGVVTVLSPDLSRVATTLIDLLQQAAAAISSPEVNSATGQPDAGTEAAAGFPAPPVEVVRAVEVIAAEPVQLLGSVAPRRQ